MKEQKVNNNQKTKNRKAKLITISLIGLLTIIICDVLFIGNVAYLVKWQECGRQPVILTHPIGVGFGASPVRNVVVTKPGIIDGKQTLIFGINNDRMHCSVDELKHEFGSNLEIQ